MGLTPPNVNVSLPAKSNLARTIWQSITAVKRSPDVTRPEIQLKNFISPETDFC